MENLTIFKITDSEDEICNCGLVRLVKNLPDYELFYHINTANSFKFKRNKDLIIHGKYYDFYHPVFVGYSDENQSYFYFFSNKSNCFEIIQTPTELFVSEEETNYLIADKPDVEYIVKSSDTLPDFSVISLPENIMFQIQNYPLQSSEKLYSLLQHYE